MKKTIAFLMVLSSMVSCTEILEEEVYSDLVAGNAYETEADAEALVLSAYAALRGTDWGTYYEYDYLNVSEQPTDTYGKDGWGPGTSPLEMGTWGINEGEIVNLWDGAYKTIGAANFAISVLEGMPIGESVKSRFIGEAKFLRALAYHDLTFNFGDVILNLGETSGDLPLSPQSEVVAQILADLTDAAAALGSSSTPGRASEGAALALRAKTNLNAKNWAAAAEDAAAVMSLGEYSLLPSIEELFNVSNVAASEWIFAVMSTTDATGSPSQLPWHELSGDYVAGAWGRLTISVDFYNSFDDNDTRKALLANGFRDARLRFDDDTGLPIYLAAEGTPEYDALAVDPEVALRSTASTSVLPNKSLGGYDRFNHPYGGDLASSGINYPVLRYADILLTRAEALNETGDTGGALALVNEIRSRSNVAPLEGLGQAALREAILEERAKEFYMEGKRRMDLIRSGQYIDRWRANLDSKYPGENFSYLNEGKIYFPIPQKEVDANDQID
ncbi:RagB/SusD family nutrient uptake outer membrane protein [Flagellimonas iocasae]|uniref:RagB/SusD family nutrient uptake outer membrane protein n=1 Tax=Flagellimonas iocasae TaxID=2055905 RepID=A0ABW4Y148_9FLAO